MAIGDYKPPVFLFNRHLETIYPAFFRKVVVPPLQRERIFTIDDDFLDLDWLKGGHNKLVIISHGLEGNSRRPYMLGMAKAFYQSGFDALTWNYRGCGDEMNRQLRFYHSGATDDLATVVKHASANYDHVYLIGFSLGGNLTLKYLGEDWGSKVKGAVAYSVPLNLATSCATISLPANRIYANRFLKSLKKKISDKARLMGGLDTTGMDQLSTLKAFDDRYTAPLHGFRDADSYYEACSSIHFLTNIDVPTLVVNAVNDPFLSPDCFPTHIVNPKVHFEFSAHGGHVGFTLLAQNGLYWSELRALEFIQNIA